MLQISGLHAWYGKSHVLHGFDLRVAEGEIVALLGRNGSGRSTAARAIMGMVQCVGSMLWQGRQIVGMQPHEIAHLGLGYVPENREVFPTLTVQQNLMLGEKRATKRKIGGSGNGSGGGGRASGRNGRWSYEDMYQLFPALRERRDTPAGVLSGGEQQMLTLCRTLMGDPDLIIIDEPTEGLAPRVVELVAHYLRELKSHGVSVLLIEQKLSIAMAVSDRVAVMGHGALVFEGTPQALRDEVAVRREWLEV